MICIKCENEAFAEKPNAVIEQEFRGEQLTVKMTALACTKCGWMTLAPSQTDELRRLSADAYRKKHGLLTSVQIKSLRKLLNMSQREFASFIGVGEASVKRWETWQVQEKSSDQLIRMKCEKELRDSIFITPQMQDWVSKPAIHLTACIALNTALWPGQTLQQQQPKQANWSGKDLSKNDRWTENSSCQAVNDELALAA
jgi:putative zinc finger/helix-turn-helix YgiT family protein